LAIQNAVFMADSIKLYFQCQFGIQNAVSGPIDSNCILNRQLASKMQFLGDSIKLRFQRIGIQTQFLADSIKLYFQCQICIQNASFWTIWSNCILTPIWHENAVCWSLFDQTVFETRLGFQTQLVLINQNWHFMQMWRLKIAVWSNWSRKLHFGCQLALKIQFNRIATKLRFGCQIFVENVVWLTSKKLHWIARLTLKMAVWSNWSRNCILDPLDEIQFNRNGQGLAFWIANFRWRN